MEFSIKTSSNIMLLVITLFFMSCDKNNTERTDFENYIIDMAFDKEYEYPTNFYHENTEVGSIYYENTVSTSEPSSDIIWIELSTNDKDQALNWSEISNGYSSVNRALISEKETEKYFEFTRQNIEYKTDIINSRVHKLTYFEPTHYKYYEPDTIGVYKGELNLENVKELVEYLWDCFSLGIIDSKVIESNIIENSTGFEHYIQSIRIIQGDFDIKDVVYIYDNYIRIDKTNRYLIIEREKTQTIIID